MSNQSMTINAQNSVRMFKSFYYILSFFKRHTLYVLFLLCFLSSGLRLNAQTTEPILNLNLSKARQLSNASNTDLMLKDIDALIANETVKQTKKGAIPEVFLDFNLQRNLIIPSTPVPAKAFNPNAPEGELLLLKFSTNWSGSAGVNFNYDLFDPEQKSKVKQAQIKAKIAATDKKITETDANLEISKIYVEALIAQEQVNLSKADLKTKSTTYKMLSEQFAAGRLTLLELNTGKAALNTADSKNKEAQNIADKTNAELVVQLGYNPLFPPSIYFEDTIEILFSNYNSPLQKNNSSFDLLKLEDQKLLLEEEKRAAKLKYYPNLNLGAYYGNNYFDNKFDPFKGSNWYGNSFIKVGLQIPLTDWFQYKNDKAIIDYQIAANDLNYKNQKNQSALNYVKTLKDVEFYKDQYENLKANFLLEQENFTLKQQQYKNGRILIEEISKADYAVQLAKNEYLNAAYNYLLAEIKMEYERAK